MAVKLKTSVSFDDQRTLENRAFNYLNKAEIPTWKGLCVALGLSSRQVNTYIAQNPENLASQTLLYCKDVIADSVEKQALEGKFSASMSQFVLKTQHGYVEQPSVSVVQHVSGKRSLAQLEAEISGTVVDASYTESDA